MIKTVDHEIALLVDEKKALEHKLKAIDSQLQAKYLIRSDFQQDFELNSSEILKYDSKLSDLVVHIASIQSLLQEQQQKILKRMM